MIKRRYEKTCLADCVFVLAIELDFVGLLRNIRIYSIDEYMKYEHTCIHEQYICLYDGSSSHHGAMQIRIRG